MSSPFPGMAPYLEGEMWQEFHETLAGEIRAQLLQTHTHILEIDLLARGARIHLNGEAPRAPYYAYLSRVRRRPFILVWAIKLEESLPFVPVPLLEPDPDVMLDLQAAVNGCFDLVGYEQLLDYATEPPGHFEPEESTWIGKQLEEMGIDRA